MSLSTALCSDARRFTGVDWLQLLGAQRPLTAAMGASLLSEPDGLNKILLTKLEDHVPHSAQHLGDFEKVIGLFRVSWLT